MDNEEKKLDSISEFLGSEEGVEYNSIVLSDDNQELIVHNPDVKSNVVEDYKHSRESMIESIKTGTSVIEKIAKVAEESESPRAYEVLANTLKTITEMNKALMELHKDAKELIEEKEKAAEVHNHNTFFNGSTDELQKLLRDSKNEG